MSKKDQDPTEPMRLKASQYPDVDKGTACTQSSFKTGGKAFLFVGMQGGSYKAMFKLDKSRGQAIKLAEKEPDLFQVGSNIWITARFTAEKPMPKKLWEKWLDESYELSDSGGSGSSAKKKTTKKPTKKKTAKKKTVKKKTVNKKAVKKSTKKNTKIKRKQAAK